MHYRMVLSVPSPSAPLLARLLEKRCRYLTRLSDMQSFPSRGALELVLGVHLLSDAVTALQRTLAEGLSCTSVLCAVCVESCRVASTTLVASGSGRPTSEESSLQVSTTICNATSVCLTCCGDQALGPPCQALCRAVATLQSLAARRGEGSSLMRLTAGRCWAVLLRALVAFAAGVPPVLRDKVACTCLDEAVGGCVIALSLSAPLTCCRSAPLQVVPRVAAWSRRAVPHLRESDLTTIGGCILEITGLC